MERDDVMVFILMPVILLASIVALGFAGMYGSAAFSCHSWRSATGEQTRIIAAECMVREGDKWVTLESHTRNNHVEVK